MEAPEGDRDVWKRTGMMKESQSWIFKELAGVKGVESVKGTEMAESLRVIGSRERC